MVKPIAYFMGATLSFFGLTLFDLGERNKGKVRWNSHLWREYEFNKVPRFSSSPSLFL